MILLWDRQGLPQHLLEQSLRDYSTAIMFEWQLGQTVAAMIAV